MVRSFALAAAVVGVAACSLGLSESDIQQDSGSAQSGTATSAGGRDASGTSTTAHGSPTSGTGGSGASSATSMSTSPATTATGGPLCGNGTCDPGENCKNCVGDCSCTATEFCGAGDACTACKSTFSVDVGGRSGFDLVLSGRTLLAGSLGQNTGALLHRIDTCSGDNDSVGVNGVAGRSVSEIHVGALGDGAIATVNYNDGNGDAVFFHGFDAALAITGPDISKSPTHGDEIYGVAGGDGLWVGHGSRDAAQSDWIAYGTTASKVCTGPALGSDQAQAIVRSGNKLFLASNTADASVRIASMKLTEVNPTNCTTGTITTFTPDLTVGTLATVVKAIAANDTTLYIAGYATNDSPQVSYAFVTSIDLATGTHASPVRSTMSASTLDVYMALALDDTSVYVGGYEHGGTTPTSSSAGVVLRYPLALPMTPDFTAHPTGAHAVVGLAVAPTGGTSYYAYVDQRPGALFIGCTKTADGCP